MFTNDGRNLVARKVGGLTDSCLDYIAIGVGGRAIPPAVSGVTDVTHQSAVMSQMVHEIARVPITSSLPTSDGIVKCMAELPNGINAEFTEVGIWTHDQNYASSHPRTQTISLFDATEGWTDSSLAPVPVADETQSGDTDYSRLTGMKYAFLAYDDVLWTMKGYRKIRKEGFRAGETGMLLRGDLSSLTGSAPFTIGAGDYVRLPLNGLPLDNASASDELRVSYFVSPVDDSAPALPSTIKMVIQFATSDSKNAYWHINHPTKSVKTTTTLNSNAVTFATGTYTWSSNTVTVTSNGHGLSAGEQVYLDFTSGGATAYSGTYTIATSATNTFTVPLTGSGTAGNVSTDFRAILRNGDILWNSTCQEYPAEFYWTGNTNGILTMKSGKNATATYNSINPIVFEDSTNATRANTYFTQYTKLVEEPSARNAIQYDDGFLWSNVVEVRVHAYVDGSSGFYVGLDALSFINTDTANPGYGMVAYDLAKNYETRGILTRTGSPTSIVFEVQIV